MDEQFYRKTRSAFSVGSWLRKQLRKRTVLLSALILLPVLSYVTFGSRGILKRMSLESEKAAMQAKVEQAVEEQKQLLEQSKALEKDPKAIEKVAREKFGMIREGETVYKVKKEK
ncbi:MAG TPA: septum formation initiator family protein [Bacteroidota bacterium]|jgi:cell division protein FtsB|nr:septum formation initiator family protein [Bacteroidota bacterium]